MVAWIHGDLQHGERHFDLHGRPQDMVAGGQMSPLSVAMESRMGWRKSSFSRTLPLGHPPSAAYRERGGETGERAHTREGEARMDTCWLLAAGERRCSIDSKEIRRRHPPPPAAPAAGPGEP
jgi:hypothetical protein